MQPGKLDERVTLQRKTRTSDSMGGFDEAWADLATVWAEVKPLGSREVWEAMRIGTQTRFRVHIRFKGDANGAPYYTSADRLTWQGRAYGIERVAEKGHRREMLELLVVEGAPS